MEIKQIEVKCPCCESRLTVDVLTRAVLRADAPAQIDETGKAKLDPGRWDGASSRVAGRTDDAQSKLDAALDRERGKEQRLDDLFDSAQDKLRKRASEED